LASDDGAALRRIVDPYEYRAAITQPKLIVLATNDRYFPVDSANLYFDALDGPKYLLYLPNDEHSISDYRRLIPSLRALHASAGSGAPFASPAWEYRWSAEGIELCVAGKPSPSRFRRWQAISATRDFRDAVWSVADRSATRATYRAAVAAPSRGYVATFVEAVFGRARGAYSVSTNLAILGGGPEDGVEPRPRGRPGVCGV
jgi:PhoPQ-activated pathogenicity-related protein